MAHIIRREFLLGAVAWGFMAAAPFVFLACGSEGISDLGDDAAVADETLVPPALELPSDLNSLESLIASDSYAGHLVVHMDEDVGARLSSATELFSLSGSDNIIASVNLVLSQHPNVELKRSVEATEEEVSATKAKLEELSGQTLADWNSIYHVDVSDPADAIILMRELKETPGVAKIYPALIPTPLGIADTPSLTGLQTYLQPESTQGGLNAQAAWTRGVRGADVYVVDDEIGINIYHEDLGLSAERLVRDGSYLVEPSCVPGFPDDGRTDCPSRIAHGTAVAGVLVGRDNGHGVTGFAPSAHYVHSAGGGTTFASLLSATNSIDLPTSELDEDIEPGSIWVIEIGMWGRCHSSPSICGHPPLPSDCATRPDSADCEYGGVPTELWPEDFAAIQQATAYGVTVVAGAANGQMNLNNPVLYADDWSFAHNLATEDAGSIMVGASQGSNENKIFYSNWGTRVNAFAWGWGVVTTGYPYGSYGWTGALPPGLVISPSDPNNYYINNFGGTSSAAAMVGGAAALVQSHARASLGGYKRYLMPSKMREIIVNSGVVQRGTTACNVSTGVGLCNIGKQPRVDDAMNRVDSFIASARSSYPELDSGAILTDARMISLRALGIGIICKENDPTHSDSICPDSQVFPSGRRLARDLDFDGDGRADLVQWTNGTWKVDLSSVGSGGDNYGAWDINLTISAISGQWVWPYVIDMNRDGRTDFVVYDKEHGTWYVALTNFNLIRNHVWHGWDWTIDYSSVWTDTLTLDPFGTNPSIPDPRYSRPVPGDYNRDGWVDIAIAGSDGNWRMDYGVSTSGGRPDGTFDRTVRYLTDAQLAVAPGWAYLAFGYQYQGASGIQSTYLSYKVPDTLPEAGRMAMQFVNTSGVLIDNMAGRPFLYGGNDSVPMPGHFDLLERWAAQGVKTYLGNWNASFYDRAVPRNSYTIMVSLPLLGIYGDNSCHPIVANFDGDNIEDRAVMCPNEWRIMYSSTDRFVSGRGSDGVRRVPLSYDESVFSLPGRSYPGGVTYEYVRRDIEFQQMLNPETPPEIRVDMNSAHTIP